MVKCEFRYSSACINCFWRLDCIYGDNTDNVGVCVTDCSDLPVSIREAIEDRDKTYNGSDKQLAHYSGRRRK